MPSGHACLDVKATVAGISPENDPSSDEFVPDDCTAGLRESFVFFGSDDIVNTISAGVDFVCIRERKSFDFFVLFR